MGKTEIRVATAGDKELLKNLINMYQNELGLYCPEYQDVDDNGYFDNHFTDVYFSGDKSIMPLVITWDGRNVGLAVISIPPYVAEGCDFCLQEIFIVGYYRGKGVAMEALQEIFKLFKGRYCTASMNNNGRALAFLRKAFAPYGVEESPFGERFTLFTASVE